MATLNDIEHDTLTEGSETFSRPSTETFTRGSSHLFAWSGFIAQAALMVKCYPQQVIH